MQPSSLRVGRINAESSACRSSSWPGLACIMTTRATASLGSLSVFLAREREGLRELEARGDFLVLRLAMARDCTPNGGKIGNPDRVFRPLICGGEDDVHGGG